MDKFKRSAVIYAAGKGTRFEGLPDGMSKCVVQFPLDEKGKSYLTPIISTMNACLSRGIYDFHIVVGYGKESVIAECDRLIRIYGKDKLKISYVENTKWDFHGCEYSVNLGLRSAIKSGASEIYLIEGDSLVSPEFLGRLVDTPINSMLVRPKDVADPKKSVICYLRDNIVNGFWYDQDHKADEFPVDEFYTSAQVWKLVVSDYLKSIVDEYLDEVEASEIPDKSSGLITLASMAESEGFLPVFIHPTEGVYNINTKEDYERVKSMLLSIR